MPTAIFTLIYSEMPHSDLYASPLTGITAPVQSVDELKLRNVFDFGTALAQDGPRLAVWQPQTLALFVLSLITIVWPLE